MQLLSFGSRWFHFLFPLQYLGELSLIDADPYLKYLPSVIAAAAFLLADYTLTGQTWVCSTPTWAFTGLHVCSVCLCTVLSARAGLQELQPFCAPRLLIGDCSLWHLKNGMRGKVIWFNTKPKTPPLMISISEQQHSNVPLPSFFPLSLSPCAK